MARTFASASSEKITLALGALPVADTDFTIAAIVKSAADGTSKGIFFAGANTTNCYGISNDTNNKLVLRCNATGLAAPTLGAVVANGLVLLAATKAAGTSTPRYHKVVLSTLAASHEDGGSTLAAFSSIVTRATIGATGTPNTFWNGDVAAVGVYNTILGDQEIEALAYDLNAFYKLSAKGLWLLDQGVTTLPVRDRTGGGANETAITGTTVSTSSVPLLSYGAQTQVIHAAPAASSFRPAFQLQNVALAWRAVQVAPGAAALVGFPVILGGSTTLTTLSATVTSTATMVRSAGKQLLATATSSAVMLRSVGKPVSATVTATAAIVKSVGKKLTANVTVTATLSAIKVILKAMTATATSTATMVRLVGKPIAATATVTASSVRQIAKRVTATVTSTATVVAIRAAVLTLTATATTTATMTRSVGKRLSSTGTVTATIARSVGKLVTATTATATASIIKSVGKRLTATTAVVTASVAAIKVIIVNLTATTVTATASIVRSVGAHMTATTITAAATIVRQVGKKMTATTALVTATLSATRAILRTLTANVTSTATMVRSVGARLSATATTTASMIKSVGKRLTASTVTATATLGAARLFARALSATVTSTATINRQVGKLLNATVTSSVTIQKAIAFTMLATATVTAIVEAVFQSFAIFLSAITGGRIDLGWRGHADGERGHIEEPLGGSIDDEE